MLNVGGQRNSNVAFSKGDISKRELSQDVWKSVKKAKNGGLTFNHDKQ